MSLSRFPRPLLAVLLALAVPLACSAADDAEDTESAGAARETSAAGEAAAGDSSTSPAIEQLRERIAEDFPGFRVDTIRPTPLDGVYEVVSDTDVMYMTADARYQIGRAHV